MKAAPHAPRRARETIDTDGARADRWAAFRSRDDIEAFDRQPGIGAEGQIGWFRRDHLVPRPEVDSIAELDAPVDAWNEDDEQRRIGGRARTAGEHFATERPP
ncbi:hypothetical protein AB0L13_09665 [Saccharopolyspora shandongensis]|uniref:hypothetical protein n=1 Tax=Saccharopolyspora shandongensis TaxID=418495 RepID=UPI00344154D7